MENKTYMCLLRSSSGSCDKPSPSEMESQLAKYQAWQEKFSENILDMGSPLGAQGSVVRHDAVTDGPFIELKEVLGGYMKLTAKDIVEATNVIKASPMVESPNVSIEIREISVR